MGKAYIAGRQNDVRIEGDFGPAHLDYFCRALWQVCDDMSVGTVTFDFSECTRTFPNAVLPVCASAAFLRSDGLTTKLIPPTNGWLRDHFIEVNWAHLIDPEHFDRADGVMSKHLVASAFTNGSNQRQLLDESIDLVLKTGNVQGSDLNALRWSLNEVTGNVLDHAQSGIGGLFQVELLRERIAFVVVDCGRGMRQSLRERYPTLRSDSEAIELATRSGVTRSNEGQGNGLSGSLRLATAFEGQFAIYSHQGGFVSHPAAPARQIQLSEPFPGTIVDLQMQRGRTVDLGSVIAGESGTMYEPWDVIGERYTSDDGRHLLVRLAEETDGFGTRAAGRQCRQKCENLLREQPEMALVLDWQGIPVVASSFADEFVGKLCASMGPLGFFSRVRFASVDPLVSRIVDGVVSQRLGSTCGASTSALPSGKHGP